MVKQGVAGAETDLDRVFHALAHATRRDMLERLSDGEKTVGELAAPWEMSLAAVSKHVQVLEDAGLVHRRRQGRAHVCRLTERPLAGAMEWIQVNEGLWSDRLDSLAALFEGGADPTHRHDGPST